MTEEELRAACKACRERYPDGDCRGCPSYADVELVQHEQSQADRIAELEEELERVKRERDAAPSGQRLLWKNYDVKNMQLKHRMRIHKPLGKGKI